MTDQDAARQKIAELVNKFAADQKRYTASTYNETQVRIEFVNPFFEALGWDLANVTGRQDVIHEDYVQVVEAGKKRPKHPDYGFRISSQTRFYVETKKPAVNLKNNAEPAYQLRRYGWSARLPVSILTDFEEMIIYDCRIQPDQNDPAHKGRLAYYTFKEYVEKWDEIAARFSREAVLNNRLEEWIHGAKAKGTLTVDDAFLNEMENWRHILAEDIANNNRPISRRDLNMSVQTTIDRIVFLRICEAREIEPYGQLEGLARTGARNVYDGLIHLFRQADAKYNSGLFHFTEEKGREEPDKLTPHLKISDDILQKIISRLYYPASPYEFSVLPADILGQIYERFLGKVIELTPGGGATVTEKPEVRKAGGVYYTPTYIVDYIVQNTVGKLVEGKTPDQVAKLKILDPACGSGSFLIGAYQFLLDWHLQTYTKDGANKHLKAKRIRALPTKEGAAVAYALTTAEKKRILLNNIYGVDLDQQAVEVTKLSLLLKVLEGETAASTQLELMGLAERVLPDLADNIKWGNSLISPDFYHGKQLSMFPEEELQRIKVFDWHSDTEGFGNIMGVGGFDAIIGNPPWGATFTESETTYLTQKSPQVPSKTKDSYFYFISQAIELLNSDRLLGFVVPNTWLLINNAMAYREFLLSWQLKEIIDYGDGVFRKATVETCTFILQKTKESDGKTRVIRLRKGIIVANNEIFKATWLDDEYKRIIVDLDSNKTTLQKRLKNTYPDFETLCGIKWGIKPYQVGYGEPPQTREMVDQRVYHATYPKDETWKPLLVGSDVNRYQLHFPGNQYIKYGSELMYMSDKSWILGPKILMRQTSDKIRASYDDKGYYPQNSIFIVNSANVDLKYLLGLLNSKLFGFLYYLSNPQTGKTFAEIKPSAIKGLPIRIINFDIPNEKTKHDNIVKLVETMLDLHLQLASATNDVARKTIQAVIDSTDRQIDNLVYELYGLTDAEIRIVEGA